jgi:hypothetical protein
MTYKSSVEKSEFLLDSLYLDYEDDDSFRSVKNDDEDDQSVRVDQSMKERNENARDENSESENSKNSDQEENLFETISSADSLTEVQSVRKNLISSPTDSSQSVRVDQIASLHAAENTLVVSANQDDDDDHFVLANDSKPNEMINSINHQTDDQIDDQSNNRLISDENNSLILNYSRSQIRHDYKQLHHKSFVKSAKIESKRAVDHDLIISKTFEQIINDSQAKE